MTRPKGFTLVELVAVMVVVGIIGSLSTQFIVTAVNSYRESEMRQKLLSKGKTSVEQMTRYLRSSVPNSVRTTASGRCVEFLPTVGGAFYEGQVADTENGAAATTSLITSPFSIELGNAEYAVLAPMLSDDIYTFASPSASASISSLNGDPVSSINLNIAHRFLRNSRSKRIYIADEPKRFCLFSDDLVLYENYGLEETILDANPGGDSARFASNVEADGRAFELSTGTEDRSASLSINLVFIERDVRVAFNQKVLIRNVP